MQNSNFIAPAVSSRLNTGFKKPMCPRIVYAAPGSEVFLTEHGFPGKQTLP